MNQILFTDFNDRKNHFLVKKKRFYLYTFIFSIVIIFIIFFYIIYNKYLIFKENLTSKKILDTYKISTLYSSNNNYTSIQLSNDISIIGLIEIPSINISYPILSETNTNLLKISVCRFAGPFPNRVGNLCMAGHNYKNNMMFSRIDELNKNDSIFISDLNNNRLEYIIYDKFSTREDNLSCTEQTSNVEITLITCNSNNNNLRIVIKAKMKEL